MGALKKSTEAVKWRSTGGCQVISRPRLRKAIIWNRSSRVWKRNWTSSKIDGSGQNRTVVPVTGSTVVTGR